MNSQFFSLSDRENELMRLLWNNELFTLNEQSFPEIKYYRDDIDSLNEKGLIMILHTELHRDYYHSIKISWDGLEFMERVAAKS